MARVSTVHGATTVRSWLPLLMLSLLLVQQKPALAEGRLGAVCLMGGWDELSIKTVTMHAFHAALTA
jgi:hypothetical protein